MVVDVCHWYVLVGKGSISLPFPCVRGWKRFHTRTRQSRVQLRSSYNRPSAGGSAWEAALQNTPTEQRDSTNKPNVPSTVCSCFLCASTCCFSHFIPCFPTFSTAFLSLSLLFPVSDVAHTLKSLCEFFTHASAMSLPGARVPPARATPSVPLEEDAAAVRGNH